MFKRFSCLGCCCRPKLMKGGGGSTRTNFATDDPSPSGSYASPLQNYSPPPNYGFEQADSSNYGNGPPPGAYGGGNNLPIQNNYGYEVPGGFPAQILSPGSPMPNFPSGTPVTPQKIQPDRVKAKKHGGGNKHGGGRKQGGEYKRGRGNNKQNKNGGGHKRGHGKGKHHRHHRNGN